jgi:hypothetical protein
MRCRHCHTGRVKLTAYERNAFTVLERYLLNFFAALVVFYLFTG